MSSMTLPTAGLIAVLALMVTGQAGASRCPDGDHSGDLDLTGDCTIKGFVYGDIRIKDGTLIVTGKVAGNIEQEGIGSIFIIAGGSVEGDIWRRVERDIDETGGSAPIVADVTVWKKCSSTVRVGGQERSAILLCPPGIYDNHSR